MPTADNSQTARIQNLRSRTIAYYHFVNPVRPELGNVIPEHSLYVTRKDGEVNQTIQPPTNPRYEIPGIGFVIDTAPQCDTLGSVLNLQPVSGTTTPDGDLIGYTWDPVPGASSYEVTTQYTPNQITISGESVSVLYYTGGSGDQAIIVTAINNCGDRQSSDPVYPCFLAGSLVTLADGSQVPIEDVKVGDLVLGAFGEVNPILALHRPLLGNGKMVTINNEHSTTSHHPHISADKKFYTVADPSVVLTKTYGRKHRVINAQGEIVDWMLYGLSPQRILTLSLGVNLKTVGGQKIVQSIDEKPMPSETQLYNLVVGGSHTYHVDGYAVTGWPREDDFDYDSWKAKEMV